MAVGDVVELEPNNVAHGGVFVARHGGRVVFVADAVDGERVRARITDDTHAAFARASTVEVLEASPWRREHVWPEAGLRRDPEDRAGGAEFGHIALEHQRELKARVVEEALRRFAGVETTVRVEPAPGDEEADGLGGRTRVRLHARLHAGDTADASAGQVAGPRAAVFGPYAARSHRVVPTASLPLAVREIAELAPLGGAARPARTTAERAIAEAAADADTIELVAPSEGEPVLLMSAAGGHRPRGGRRPGRRTRPSRRRWATDARGAPLDDPVVTESVMGLEFRVAASGFWQVHRRAAEVLYRAVVDAVDRDLFDPEAENLDLYGGVGLLGAALGARAGGSARVTSVESFAPATAHAARNLAAAVGGPGVRAVTARVDAYLARLVASASRAEREALSRGTVVLDPPRSGAGRESVEALARLHPRQLVYVACDPVALARDLKTFAEHGYRARRIRAFDLFPHTHHVETVVAVQPEE